MPSPTLLTNANMVVSQGRDWFCNTVKEFVLRGVLPEGDNDVSSYILLQANYFQVTDEGVLVHLAHSTPKQGVMLTQTVVPKSLQPLVLELAHDDASASHWHAGIQATHTRLIEQHWWQELAADVRTYVSSCHACQMRKPSNTTAIEQN